MVMMTMMVMMMVMMMDDDDISNNAFLGQGILATAAYDYKIKIWNLIDTKAETHSLDGHEDQVSPCHRCRGATDPLTGVLLCLEPVRSAYCLCLQGWKGQTRDHLEISIISFSPDPDLHPASLDQASGGGRLRGAEEGRQDRLDQRRRVPRCHRIQQTVRADNFCLQVPL